MLKWFSTMFSLGAPNLVKNCFEGRPLQYSAKEMRANKLRNFGASIVLVPAKFRKLQSWTKLKKACDHLPDPRPTETLNALTLARALLQMYFRHKSKLLNIMDTCSTCNLWNYMKYSRLKFLKQVKNFAALNARMKSRNTTLAITQTVGMIFKSSKQIKLLK